MFSRKKPPQLTALEELQQTYDDSCNLSIQNLTLEEGNHLDQALKGWKSLHTSMLYKTHNFEQQSSKFDEEQLRLLQELKDIRDQNVRHLIRVQMRIDEEDRRRQASHSSQLVQGSTSHAQRPSPPSTLTNGSRSSSKMSVPSLRNSNAPSSRSLSSTTQSRQMLKTLRPGAAAAPSNIGGNSSAAAAASVSWRQPSQQSIQTVLLPSGGRKAATLAVDPQFADFDQDQWERVTRLPTPDLVDLDDDLKGLGLSSTGGYRSMEDLVSKNDIYPATPPAPPPPRKLSPHPRRPSPTPTSNPNPNPNSTSTSNSLSAPKITHGSKSTSDIRTEPKKYVYNKPKPFNVNEIMRVQAKKKAAAAVGSNPAASSVPKKATKSTTAVPLAKPSGIHSNPLAKQPGAGTYKTTTIPKIYVKKSPAINTKVQPKKKLVKEEINSPTMDDILGGYEPHIEKEDNKKEEEVSGDKGLTDEQEDELIASIRGIDQQAAKQILNDIVVHGDEVYWGDIAGLESAKNSLKEAVVYPFLRPDLFSGLREPARGLLLFGPPGTGKTMLARAVATESKSTFFSISASSLTSKYLGESEKLVKALFLLARKLSPSIVFVDEIDSLLSTRTDGEVDSSRRIKNEFLIQWSELSSAAAGRDTSNDVGDVSRVLILGATNVPWAIDEAARRRFVRRQYIPLPENETRRVHLQHLLGHQKHTLSSEDFDELVKLTQGFSGSDITALAKDAAMGPLRSLGDLILNTPRDQIRPVGLNDFISSLQYIRPSVLVEGLSQHEEWASLYGSYGG